MRVVIRPLEIVSGKLGFQETAAIIKLIEYSLGALLIFCLPSKTVDAVENSRFAGV